MIGSREMMGISRDMGNVVGDGVCGSGYGGGIGMRAIWRMKEQLGWGEMREVRADWREG